MLARHWQETALGTESPLWEQFHENSKLGRFSLGLSGDEVRRRVGKLHESLPFEGYPTVPLPRRLPALKAPLGQAIASRVSVRELAPQALKLDHLAALLHFGYGKTGRTVDLGFDRPLRVVPSAGALYPLEIFFHTTRVEGLQPGLYHYNPAKHHLRHLREGDLSPRIGRSVVQNTIPRAASLTIFITALFERSVFKYGERGYRFVLLEAGHVAQNINLVAAALGLGCLNIGGFFDREIDDFLSLDGITHSTIYMIAIGKRREKLSSHYQVSIRR